jgi:hypothetical protein
MPSLLGADGTCIYDIPQDDTAKERLGFVSFPFVSFGKRDGLYWYGVSVGECMYDSVSMPVRGLWVSFEGYCGDRVIPESQ